MAFDGSAIKALLDGAVAKGTLHGVAAVVVDRNGALFHHAAGEASERSLVEFQFLLDGAMGHGGE